MTGRWAPLESRHMHGPCVRWPLLFALASGCASTGGVETEVSRLRREVHSLKSELAETRLEIERLQTQVTGLRAVPVQATETSAVAPAGPAIPKLPVVRLRRPERRAPASGGEDPDLGAIDDGGPPVLIKVGPGAGGDEKLPVDHEVLKKPDPVLSSAAKSKKDIEGEYKLALDTLREQQRPGEAKALFVAFRQRYPSSELIDNAAYWIAECSFLLEQHQGAIREFEELIEKHPMSSKVPDALLRVGQSWAKLGKPESARSSWERVRSGYPDSEAAQAADKALRALSSEKR